MIARHDKFLNGSELRDLYYRDLDLAIHNIWPQLNYIEAVLDTCVCDEFELAISAFEGFLDEWAESPQGFVDGLIGTTLIVLGDCQERAAGKQHLCWHCKWNLKKLCTGRRTMHCRYLSSKPVPPDLSAAFVATARKMGAFGGNMDALATELNIDAKRLRLVCKEKCSLTIGQLIRLAKCVAIPLPVLVRDTLREASMWNRIPWKSYGLRLDAALDVRFELKVN